jgi:hypothetical protein
MSEAAKPDTPASGTTSTSPSEKGHSVVHTSTENNGANEFELVHTPHLHAKTFLTVFAVCLIYIAQTFTLVGAGAVCLTSQSSSMMYAKFCQPTARPTYCWTLP